MSWSRTEEARCLEAPSCPPVELVIEPKPKDIGAFEVRRALPTRLRRAVGPFVFFDEMGPARLPPGQGMDVRPHPHVNLATLTYLFEGAILHRDSLGTEQLIAPGAVNLMVAGRGIVHSERSPDAERSVEARLHGLQLWIALPEADEEVEPSFHHYPASSIPEWTEGGARWRLLVGAVGERRSPVRAFSEVLYAAADLEPGGAARVPDAPERGVYVVDGEIRVAGVAYGPGALLVLRPEVTVEMRSDRGARVAVVGGAPLGPRFMDWNFVSSRRERIATARADWAEDRFPRVPGDAGERIPLPD